MLIFCQLYSDICIVNSRNLVPNKIFSPLLEALCIKYFRNVPKKLFSISHWSGLLLLLLLLPRVVYKSLHGCLGLSRIRDQDWALGSPWAMDRGPRGGLVSWLPIFTAMKILTLHSSFPAWPNTSQNFCDPFQPPFTIGCSLEHLTLSAAIDLYFVPKKRWKKAYLAFVLRKAKLSFFLWCWKKLFTDFKTKTNWSECWVITSRLSLK